MSSRWLRAKNAAAPAVFAALALPWLFCASALAAAELDLSWRSPVGCPDESWASERIAAQLGRVLSESAAPLRAEVVITRSSDRFRLTLHTVRDTTTGERSLEDARCEVLAEAATLMIALAIDPDAVLQAQTQSGVSAPGTQAVSPASTTRPATSVAAPVAPTAVKARAAAGAPPSRFHARMSVLADVGFLPALAYGPQLAIGAQQGRFGGELSGFWLPERRSTGRQRVAVGVWALALHGCMQRASDRWLVGGCLGPELGRVSADGMGLRENLEKRGLFAALSLPSRARLRLAGPVWLALDVGLAVPLHRQRFVTLNTSDQTQTALHTPQPLNARGSLGVEFSF